MSGMPSHMILRIYLAVGFGGMIGAMGRYGISALFGSSAGFPYATLTTNLIGCFLLSFLLHHNLIKRKLSPEVFTGLGTGIIGSFTTFSTFAVETIELWNENVLLAATYVFLSIIAGLAFSYGGFKLANRKQVTA